MNLNYSQLPNWLESNSLFRKLFLIRKLYLTKTRQSHYSQFAEDVSIARFFPKRFRGFYVDVGCFHPRKYSNTWRFYRAGWRGINIDIDSIKIEGFNLARPQDTNVHCAVSNTEGVLTFYSNGFYSLGTSLEGDFAKGKTGYVEKKVQSRKLTNIIDESRFRDRKIDFLSVDAEGHDLDVLESLDFERYEPRLIAVETHKAIFSEVEQTPLYGFLRKQQYCLVGWCGLTLLMANRDLQESLATPHARISAAA